MTDYKSVKRDQKVLWQQKTESNVVQGRPLWSGATGSEEESAL